MSLKTEARMKKGAIIGALVLGVLMLASGVGKLAGFPMAVQMFAAFGLPTWTLYAVGAIEVACAALLFTPKVRFFGALGVFFVMLGAAAVHLMSNVMLPMIFVNAVLGAAAAWIASKSGNSLLALDAATDRSRHLAAR